MNLDQPGRFAEVDPHDALGDVEGAAALWSAARAQADVRLALDDVSAVVVSGVGGSGVTGDLVVAVAEAEGFGLPVVVSKGYGLPAWAGKETLVVAVSYSGGTEETCDALETALARGCRTFAVASGGALGERCELESTPWVRVPGGGMPRHSTGWLAVPVLVALGLDAGLDEAIAMLEQIARRCHRDVPVVDNPAKQLGLALASGGIPLVWGAQGVSALAAYRLKCQLNENAKLVALSGALPEANHNEVVAWQEASSRAGLGGLVLLRDPAGEHPRLARRAAATLALLGPHAPWTREVTTEGRAPLARLASVLELVDLASVYAALALDRDPTPIPFIDRLKAELARER